MLQDNYTQDLPIFKGVTVKYFRESEDNNSYEAFIEMPVKEHHCPHCGYTTTYIKDYRLQKVKDLSLAGKPLKVTISKRRYICKNCNSTFQKIIRISKDTVISLKGFILKPSKRPSIYKASLL